MENLMVDYYTDRALFDAVMGIFHERTMAIGDFRQRNVAADDVAQKLQMAAVLAAETQTIRRLVTAQRRQRRSYV